MRKIAAVIDIAPFSGAVAGIGLHENNNSHRQGDSDRHYHIQGLPLCCCPGMEVHQ